MLSTANGRPVVIDGGKAGILIELDAQTGKLLWKLPVGAHEGHENEGLLAEHATPTSRGLLPAQYCLEPSTYGGIVTQLASNGSTTFAAVNDLALLTTPAGYTESEVAIFEDIEKAGSNAPVAVDGDYVIAGAGAALPPTQRDMIIAYKLGATGKLPDTVGS